MSYSDGAPAGPLVAPFWEMLALLAQEPGMEWLERALAGQADPFWRRSQGAARRTAAVVHPGASRQRRERGSAGIGEMVAKHRDVLQPELLYLSDLQLMERRVAFHLRNSSVDQERHVISLGLSEEPWVCPVLAVQSYMSVRSQLEGPLFIHLDNTAVTRRDFLTVLRGALQLLGLRPEQYGVHSFWLGTAVTAARCGYPREDVTRLARWPCMVLNRP
ncbi:uncharacterized protein PRD47_011540 isoform 1-T1 [Ara ararauna]